MENDINPHTPIWQLTVGEFMELQKRLLKLFKQQSANRYEYGLKGIAKIFGVSRSKAQEIKNSGMIDEAIFQNGKTIIIDREKALELFKNNI